MSPPPAPPAPPTPAEQRPALATDPRWAMAEDALLVRLDQLSRWQAERWAAGHERRLSPLASMAVRVAAMQLAIERGRDGYLEAAFERLAAAAAGADWVGDHCGGACTDPAHREATAETVEAVTELAQQALMAVVVAGEAAAGLLRADRAAHLDQAARSMLGASVLDGSWPPGRA